MQNLYKPLNCPNVKKEFWRIKMTDAKPMNIAKLATAIEKERAKFTQLLTVKNPRIPKPSYFSMHNLEAFGINVVAMGSKKRKSGAPYMVHPATSAYIVSMLATGKLRDQAIAYVLFHDLIDEALEYNQKKFFDLQKKYGAEFAQEFSGAILLAPPYKEGFLKDKANSHMARKYAEKVAEVSQVRDSGDKALAIALIADKIDGMLDLSYLVDSTSRDILITRWHVAYPLFAAAELEGMLPKDTRKLVRELADHTCSKFGYSVSTVLSEARQFEEAKQGLAAEISAQIKHHQQTFGYRP
jgi:(p)ppGpp synthase/HD superfamily hydrolase